eukprot:CAMPEP_0119148790 /NCGR_PEP_ID=MMETSP1310-20130426/42374_1 /TAXON_ID=464262 /ORGANISM="Genus nov. species nov., Strain RCC2339" /LENGTH=91 /DNA_ID=CAMNT_0007140845 /DNA_START=1 /DNA_END=272 /DNA_ORIENTATION=+
MSCDQRADSAKGEGLVCGRGGRDLASVGEETPEMRGNGRTETERHEYGAVFAGSGAAEPVGTSAGTRGDTDDMAFTGEEYSLPLSQGQCTP